MNRKLLFIHYAIIDKEGFGRTFMFAREMAKMGHQVTFLTTLPSSRFAWPYHTETRDNVKLLAFPDILPDNFRRTGFVFFSALLKLVYLIGNHNFDLVHSDTGHRPSAAIPSVFCQLVYRIPHVTEWWDDFGRGGQFDDKSFFKKLTHGFYDLYFQKPFIKLSSHTVVLSHYLKAKAMQWGVPENKITILHGGADDLKIPFSPNSSAAKSKKGIPPDTFTFGFIGMNSGELRDILPFIEAVVRLKDRFPINWFTTGGTLSPEFKKQYGIGTELHEFGWQSYDDYAVSLSAADAFILIQQDTNGNLARWPNKLGDYLAAGRLVLCNPVGDMAELMTAHPKAFVRTENNTESIMSQIEWMMDNKEELVGQRSSIRYISETKYSWKSKSSELLDIYTKLIDREN
jgi:glycosyltransferase involved in cell wall biosynthesis